MMLLCIKKNSYNNHEQLQKIFRKLRQRKQRAKCILPNWKKEEMKKVKNVEWELIDQKDRKESKSDKREKKASYTIHEALLMILIMQLLPRSSSLNLIV